MYNFESWLEIFSILLGVFAVFYPICSALMLIGKSKLGTATALMFIGEGVAMSITVVFAVLAFWGYLKDLGGVTQSFMRILMFSIAISTSIYLRVVLTRITNKNNGE